MPEPLAPASAVPPPTTEVTVRTMASDIEAVRASGGSTQAVAGPATAVSVPSHETAHPVSAAHRSHAMSALLGWLAVLIGILVLAAGAYLGYDYLTRTPEGTVPATVPAAVLPGATGQEKALATLPRTVSGHRSLLVQRPAFSGTFPVEPRAGELKTRTQLLREALDGVPASARTAELAVTDAKGDALSFPGYATLVGSPELLDAAAYDEFLEGDFTLLAVRGQGGFSLAYVLALEPGATWLYAEPRVRGIEIAPGLENLFLAAPGVRADAFIDATVADEPARVLTYASPDGALYYGFLRDRLVIATSRQALDGTLALLCLDLRSC